MSDGPRVTPEPRMSEEQLAAIERDADCWATPSADVAALVAEVRRLRETLRDIRDNFDCDVGPATQDHQCQECIARAAIDPERARERGKR